MWLCKALVACVRREGRVLSWDGGDGEMGVAGLSVPLPQQMPLEPHQLLCSCLLHDVWLVICDNNYNADIYNSFLASKILSSERQIPNN